MKQDQSDQGGEEESCWQKNCAMRCKYRPSLMFLNKYKGLKQPIKHPECQRRKTLVKSYSYYSEVLISLMQAQLYRITYTSVAVIYASFIVRIYKCVKMLFYCCRILLAQTRTSPVFIQIESVQTLMVPKCSCVCKPCFRRRPRRKEIIIT